MIRNKLFVKFICVLLLASFLTLSVGKVQRASAIATSVATVVGATLCAVGIGFCSYMALTNASIHIPDTIDNIHDWLIDVGSKVVEFPSGREAYNELYPHFARSPVGSLLHDFLNSEVWTWTADKIKAWANDFSSQEVISNILSYDAIESAHGNYLYNSYDYAATFNIVDVPHIVYTYSNQSFESLVSDGYIIEPYAGYHYIYGLLNGVSVESTDIVGDYRNYFDGSNYKIQKYLNDEWVDTSVTFHYGYDCYTNSNVHKTLLPDIWGNYYNSYDYTSPVATITISSGTEYSFPPFTDVVIYDAVNDINLPLEVPSTLTRYTPQWPMLPNDNDYNLPAPIPYVQLPFDSTWIDPITGTGGGGNWGFNLGDMLDKLEDLANTFIEIGIIADLINDFKNSLSGDPSDMYYIYYDDSQNNYYDYYTITNFGDNTQYIYNYDYDVSETDKHLPVDLNTISTYSNNRYVDTFKSVANTGSSIIGDLVVFWHNVDPDIIYTLFGCAIITLIAAFIGKWGHS